MPLKNEKKTGKGLIMLVGALLLIILTLVGYIGLDDSHRDTIEGLPIIGGWLAEDEPTEVQVPLDEFLINSTNTNGRDHMVRLEVALGSMLPDIDEYLMVNNAKVREDVIYVLAQETTDALVKTESDTFVVAETIKTRINASLGDDVITDVYITDLLIQ